MNRPGWAEFFEKHPALVITREEENRRSAEAALNREGLGVAPGAVNHLAGGFLPAKGVVGEIVVKLCAVQFAAPPVILLELI